MAEAGYISKTDEVLVLLNRYTQASHAGPPDETEFGDFQGAHAAETTLNGTRGKTLGAALQSAFRRVSKDHLAPKPVVDDDRQKLRVVLGESADLKANRRERRRRTDSFRRKLFGVPQGQGVELTEESVNVDSVRVHPLSHFRRYWDACIILMVIYSVVVLPVRAAFWHDYWAHLPHVNSIWGQIREDWWLIVEIFIDLFFMGDIILNFNTGFILEQVLVMERHAVARYYSRGWFFLDLICAVPLDLLFFGSRVDVWRLPRILKVLRVMKMPSLAAALHYAMRMRFVADMNRFHVRIIKLILFCAIYVHWDACLQYGAAVAQGFPPGCWVEQAHLLDASHVEKYSWALLNAFSTMVTAGYGPYNPVTTMDCWVLLASLVMGVSIFTTIGSMVTSMLVHLNASSSEYAEKMSALNQYMQHQKLPQELRQRIRDSYEARWKAEKHFDEEEILEELPGSLRTEVCLHTCHDLITCVPFFEDAEEGFVTSLVTLLHPQVYLAGDVIIREGEVSREMYFIKAGAVQIEVNGNGITVLKKGSYFGEIGLLREARRNASVRALSDCDIFVLTKEDFDHVMKDYPQMSHAMNLVAEHRIRALQTSSAWQAKHKDKVEKKLSGLGSRLEHALETHGFSNETDSDESDSGTAPVQATPSPSRPAQPSTAGRSQPTSELSRHTSRRSSLVGGAASKQPPGRPSLRRTSPHPRGAASPRMPNLGIPTSLPARMERHTNEYSGTSLLALNEEDRGMYIQEHDMHEMHDMGQSLRDDLIPSRRGGGDGMARHLLDHHPQVIPEQDEIIEMQNLTHRASEPVPPKNLL
ncbi:hypothetical protein WJX72_002193 [[Myrmecia] bisecta]|uniref:Cyclic nucleotide-binding domain-containing protein n=1 Tax=[Myrmecia] bisecta TaxID=41462 RepID=A0AAW1QEC9_9CHLO